MMFQPTNILTGEQICVNNKSARQAVLTAFAVCEMGDLDVEQYESRYGHLLVCSPSYLSDHCIWSAGHWHMFSPVEGVV